MPSQKQQGQQVPTRWSPTPEQLMILEEMYRGGLRTPNAWQIQQITAHLASYGRIKGKNVFYWFQNHKARDRQKLRRRLCLSHRLLTCAQYYAAAHHHHGGFLGGGGVVTPVTMPVALAYGCGGGGVFDHQAAVAGQLLAPTSATAAAAAAAYGYYHPATAFAAAPARRCGATTPPSPNQLFNYHQGGGAGVAPAEALGRPEYSLGKLDNFGVDDAGSDDMGRPGFEVAPPPTETAFCRPLKTLDLFPDGLKDEQHDVA